jgi:hypothetical protein
VTDPIEEASFWIKGLQVPEDFYGSVQVVLASVARDLVAAETKAHRQALWDIYGILGFDQDGNKEPHVSDLIGCVVRAATEFRADYDDLLNEIPLRSELSPPTTHPCPKCGGDGGGWSMGVGGEPEWWECGTCKTTGELSPPTTPDPTRCEHGLRSPCPECDPFMYSQSRLPS